MITIFSTPSCIQCNATKREMDRKGINYSMIDITKDEAAHAKVTGLGYSQAPVVIAGDDHWSGFRPDKIGALA